MKKKLNVRRKQPNSKMCMVCGRSNLYGLKAAFYEMENDELIAIFTPQEEHQSYPGRMHGGISAAVLDETIGRAIMARYDEGVWGVTIEFSIRFKKPIPLDEELKVMGRITEENSRIFKGTGEIRLASGEVAASGAGTYLKMSLEKIADFDFEEQEWKVDDLENDPEIIEI
jgi:uncharacterized protein (TIGR00369 family)